MLTRPKWQTVWLKSQCFSRRISTKIMYAKPADKILDDISNSCNSTSKELTLEALNCWRIWIENQQVDDWKQNETCYFVVRPLRTKKFHPLHKDSEVSEIKLSLMWLALQKMQYLMHFEGPQHVLEVFIQSCVSWLSCSEVESSIHKLILKLVSSLFSKDVKIQDRSDMFPPLKNNVLQSNKLFCRLLNSLMEILYNWTKIKEKTDLLFIWRHFLDHCEASSRSIPVLAWHKIFKLVETVCTDETELIENKMALLHMHAISLRSVMSNSKVIDCSQLLTTPAEALLRIAVELSVNNGDENISFETFKYCQEICRILTSYIIHMFDYEFCIHLLSKIEDADSKPLLWGLWCGMAECFGDKVGTPNLEQCDKGELKLYRKLRSIAVNFDLDAEFLEEKSISTIQVQLNFLRVGRACEHCYRNPDRVGVEKASDVHSSDIVANEAQVDISGRFRFPLRSNSSTAWTVVEDENKVSHVSLDSLGEDKCIGLGNADCGQNRDTSFDYLGLLTNGGVGVYRGQDKSHNVKSGKMKDWRWLICNLNAVTLHLRCHFMFLCNTLRNERLITYNCHAQKGILVAPVCLMLMLDKLCASSRKFGDSSHNLIENVRRFENKVREGQIFDPVKLYVSFRGRKGLELCSDTVRFWYLVNEIVYDADFEKNVQLQIARSDKSILWLCIFLFLVNFAKNSFLESMETASPEGINPFVGNQMREMMSLRTISFMKKVIRFGERLSRSAFLDSLSDIVPMNRDNPILLWKTSVKQGRSDAWDGTQSDGLRARIHSGANGKGYNENMLGIFNYFDDFQKYSSRESQSLESVAKRKESPNTNPRANRVQRLSSLRPRHSAPNASCGETLETAKIKVLQAPPDIFRSLTFSEWKLEDSRIPANDGTRSVLGEPRNSANKNKTDRVCGDTIECAVDEVATPRKSKRLSKSGNRKRTIKSMEGETAECKRPRNEPAAGCQVLTSPKGESKENVSTKFTTKTVYSLRQRPLRQTAKLNEMKCLMGLCCGKRKMKSPGKSNKNEGRGHESPRSKSNTAVKDCAVAGDSQAIPNNSGQTEGREISSPEADDGNGLPVKDKVPTSDDIEPGGADSPFEDQGPSLSINLKPEICDDGTCAEELSIKPVIKLQEFLKRPQVDNEPVGLRAIVTVRVKSEDFDADESSTEPTSWSSGVSTMVKVECTDRGVKRQGDMLDCGESPKKIKLEMGAWKELLEDVVSSKLEDVVGPNPACGETSTTEDEPPPNGTKETCHKSDVPVPQNRGSRMLALIPASPKINRFHDSSPSSKHQAVKPPNVVKNSRASKMLALLPELQDTSSTSGTRPEGEGAVENNPLRDDNAGKGVSGYAPGKIHHLVPNGFPVSALSPKRSPIRQRKSIRFDDDRNETVTYYTDSPPCLTVVQGLRCKRIEK